MKTILKTGLVLLASVSLIACGNKGGDRSASLGDIMVVSREDGSGTRGAFTELTGVLQKSGDTEVDQTIKAATIQNNTEGIVRTVSGNPSAIGYMSLGVFWVMLPAARSGIFSATILGIGRAIGETMAVILVAGNQPVLPTGWLRGVRTMTTNIVLEMAYASGEHREALIATAAVLFLFILMINAGFIWVKRRGE